MLMNANIKRSFTSMFTTIYNYKFKKGWNTWRLLIISQTDIFEDLQMTGFLTLKEQSIYNTMYDKVLCTVWTSRLQALQEVIDLLKFNS